MSNVVGMLIRNCLIGLKPDTENYRLGGFEGGAAANCFIFGEVR
jgi:hypothetical protein